MEEIATERNMAVGTIEGHLTYFVGIGELDINTVIDSEKLDLIKSAIEKHGTLSNKILKENLPENISYGQIRMVIASFNSIIS
jgi:ATP-dependent DNA helicase RecQ